MAPAPAIDKAGLSLHRRIAAPHSTKKVTVSLPAALLERVQAATGRGTTEVITMGLEELDRREKQRQLASLRGTIDFDLDLDLTRQ